MTSYLSTLVTQSWGGGADVGNQVKTVYIMKEELWENEL